MRMSAQRNKTFKSNTIKENKFSSKIVNTHSKLTIHSYLTIKVKIRWYKRDSHSLHRHHNQWILSLTVILDQKCMVLLRNKLLLTAQRTKQATTCTETLMNWKKIYLINWHRQTTSRFIRIILYTLNRTIKLQQALYNLIITQWVSNSNNTSHNW